MVQGPQLMTGQPHESQIVMTAELADKYLGRGIIGFGPYLEVLSNRDANELIAKYGYDLFRRMLMDSEVDASTDAIVQASTSQALAVMNPIPYGKDGHDVAQEITNFVTKVLGRLPIDEWRKQQIRQALAFGNAVSEIDWEVATEGPLTGKIIIDRLRLQRPEDYAFVVDRWGEVYGVAPVGQAGVFPLGNLIPLLETTPNFIKGIVPRYKISLWTWDMQATDPRGTSILIPAYIGWWSKQRTIEEWSCWLARYSQPSLWATPGPNAVPSCVVAPNGHQTITQPTEALLQALIQFKSASVLALPYGSELNMLQATGSVEPFLKSIEAWDRQITRAILGQHLATSEGENQSRSAAEIHALVLRQLIGSVRGFMARMIQEEIINPLVEANYPDLPDELYPLVNLGDSDGFPPTVTEIAVLFQSGYFSEDQLPIIDKMLGLPVRTTNNRVGAGNLPPAAGQPQIDALPADKQPVTSSDPQATK